MRAPTRVFHNRVARRAFCIPGRRPSALSAFDRLAKQVFRMDSAADMALARLSYPERLPGFDISICMIKELIAVLVVSSFLMGKILTSPRNI